MSLPVGTAYQLVATKSDATGLTNMTLAGTSNEIAVGTSGTTITLSTPQAIGTASTPTFASETLSATTNQLVLGTTKTTTLSATQPGTSRTYTIPDAGGAANVMLDAGAYTVTGTWTGCTLVTPALGTPASGALTNCTSIPVASATGTLTVGHGGTGQTALSAFVPTIQKFTSGSGTYSTPAGVTWIKVKMVGGGGGGGSSGTAANNAGTNGGNTTFGSSLLTANGGTGGTISAAAGAAGGTASLGTGPIGVALAGANGMGGGLNVVNVYLMGGMGGVSPFGGAGGSTAAAAAANAVTNSGSGGGGGGTGATASSYSGGSGAAGGYVEAIITAPSASYAYAVGTGGALGGAGTNGFAGGTGGSGIIIVEEHLI